MRLIPGHCFAEFPHQFHWPGQLFDLVGVVLMKNEEHTVCSTHQSTYQRDIVLPTWLNHSTECVHGRWIMLRRCKMLFADGSFGWKTNGKDWTKCEIHSLKCDRLPLGLCQSADSLPTEPHLVYYCFGEHTTFISQPDRVSSWALFWTDFVEQRACLPH